MIFSSLSPGMRSRLTLSRARADAPRPREEKNRSLRQAGFTLIELLVVIGILGSLIALVAPSALRQMGNAKGKIAQQAITRISGVLDLYKLDVGVYPTTQQGLNALIVKPQGVANWSGPYVQDAQGLVDPWGAPFQYRAPSQRPGRAFDLYSFGPSGSSADRREYIMN